MQDKAAVQAHVWDYLQTHNLSVRELARRAEIPEATLARMLRDDPSYQGQPHRWQQLARFPELGLNEGEVLAAVGLGPALPASNDTDPWTLLEAAMRGFRLTERYRDHLRRQVEFLLAAHQTEAPNGC